MYPKRLVTIRMHTFRIFFLRFDRIVHMYLSTKFTQRVSALSHCILKLQCFKNLFTFDTFKFRLKKPIKTKTFCWRLQLLAWFFFLHKENNFMRFLHWIWSDPCFFGVDYTTVNHHTSLSITLSWFPPGGSLLLLRRRYNTQHNTECVWGLESRAK